MIFFTCTLFLSCIGFALFCRPELISYNIPSSQKKDHEAFINSCKVLATAISKCDRLDQLLLLSRRIRALERPAELTYNRYAYHMGELWVHFNNKRMSLYIS